MFVGSLLLSLSFLLPSFFIFFFVSLVPFSLSLSLSTLETVFLFCPYAPYLCLSLSSHVLLAGGYEVVTQQVRVCTFSATESVTSLTSEEGGGKYRMVRIEHGGINVSKG